MVICHRHHHAHGIAVVLVSVECLIAFAGHFFRLTMSIRYCNTRRNINFNDNSNSSNYFSNLLQCDWSQKRCFSILLLSTLAVLSVSLHLVCLPACLSVCLSLYLSVCLRTHRFPTFVFIVCIIGQMCSVCCLIIIFRRADEYSVIVITGDLCGRSGVRIDPGRPRWWVLCSSWASVHHGVNRATHWRPANSILHILAPLPRSIGGCFFDFGSHEYLSLSS